MTTPVYNPNYLGALFSFLRVLVVALSSALLPMFVGAEEYPTGKAVGIACGAAFLLTVVNYFRDGETRFGTPPNLGAPQVVEAREFRMRGDGGYVVPAMPLLVVGLLLILAGVVIPSGVLMWVGVVLAVVGVVLMFLA